LQHETGDEEEDDSIPSSPKARGRREDNNPSLIASEPNVVGSEAISEPEAIEILILQVPINPSRTGRRYSASSSSDFS
jgi:hypothetical protein